MYVIELFVIKFKDVNIRMFGKLKIVINKDVWVLVIVIKCF